MWPDLVVVSAVSLQLFLRIRKGQEPLSVQTFSAELAARAFDESIEGSKCKFNPVYATALAANQTEHRATVTYYAWSLSPVPSRARQSH